MRFVLTFKTGADVALEIPEADLKRHPETMLSVMSRPRWTGPEGTPEVLRVEAVTAAETHWSDGMAKTIISCYARDAGDHTVELPAPVELQDFIPIADWLLLPLGDLSKITYGAETADGNLARLMRAKLYLKLREDRAKTMTGIRDAIKKEPKEKYHFGFFAKTDDFNNPQYNHGNEPGVPLDRFIPDKCLASQRREQERRFGTKQSAYKWSRCKKMRDETKRELERYGFEASWENVKATFRDGASLAHRWILHVTLPQVEPASKRRHL